ncbi:MAG: cysteine--tRNA ligase [Candidatus Gastranaerophilales bacterium]|nr:cysteine--tRNA ligase [Candidatus Gastranaerophilales bacterium]
MKVFNSYSRQLEDLIPLEENKITMYVCGPTVYDLPHLGHARCYITWDVVFRYLKFRGYDVTYARNITDVDDKIINKAKSQNTTPKAIAEEFTKEFHKSMKALNLLEPTIEPKATENIDAMLEIINILVEKGVAYEKEGDVYFKVDKFPKYGNLSGQNIKDLEAGARVEASGIKENALDFAMWKKAKDEDEISWDSPYGKGRPGWHIECSAMAKGYLGNTIDIHAGGADLLFPHHENEIAQSECACGKPFARYWLHNGFVTINNEKMSKSLGNFTSINKLLESYDANTIKLFILTNHYRQPVEFSQESLESAKAGIQRLKNAVNDLKTALNIKEFSPPSADNKHIQQFIEAMDSDFNTSKALSVFFELANLAQKEKETDKEKAFEYISTLVYLSDVLGFNLTEVKSIDNDLTEKLMNLIIGIRKLAREEKNWIISDKIRDELNAIGITLKDNKDGATVFEIK